MAAKPAAALALGLVAHELTTNAVKYGALSKPKGRVAIAWKINGAAKRKVDVQWCEINGPPAKKPAKTGFGTELIERELKSMLRGSAKIDYAPDGLRATLSIPVDPTLVSVKSD